MEIKNVVNEVENNYPKMKQINKKDLKNNIPNKWKNIGIFSFGIIMVMRNKVLAVNPATIDVAGGFPVKQSIYDNVYHIIQNVLVITFIISGLYILITKIKYKKQNKPKKVGIVAKVIFIISILLTILSFIVKAILDNT